MRLIVNSFKPQLQEELHPVRWPTNLYRDDEFKTTIQAFRHAQVQASIARQAESLAPLSGGKGDVSQGIVASKGDEWSFKEGTTKVASLGGAASRRAGSASAAKVKGGASGKRAAKAAVKAATQAAKEQIRDSLKLNRSLTDTAAGDAADWTQPYAKITAEELEGCYVCACFPAVMFYGTGRQSRTCAPRASQNARTLVCAQNGGMTNPHHVLPLGVGMFKRSAEGPDTYVDAGVILYCSSLKFVHT